MTDTVDRITPIPPAPQATAGGAQDEPRERPAPEAAEIETHRPEPIALDVARGEDGVFVYTLTDPSTGRLVAVIPDTREARTAGNYASGGWVSLTA